MKNIKENYVKESDVDFDTWLGQNDLYISLEGFAPDKIIAYLETNNLKLGVRRNNCIAVRPSGYIGEKDFAIKSLLKQISGSEIRIYTGEKKKRLVRKRFLASDIYEDEYLYDVITVPCFKE